jgi:sugar phosphate permease
MTRIKPSGAQAFEPATAGNHRWVVFGVICLIYFFVYFHRVSPSVIASDLLTDFEATAASLGFMSSLYFYLYAAMQPIVGYLADRWGARRVIAYFTLLASAGSFLFGLAPSLAWASAARALIGIGVAGVYVPAVKALSLWFSRQEFGLLIGLLMAVGNIGAVVATTPLAWAAAQWGWRSTFILIGIVSMGLAVLNHQATRDPENAGLRQNASSAADDIDEEKTLWAEVFGVIRSIHFWVFGGIFFGIYGTLVTLQGLWATPFLMAAFGIERILASQLNMLIPLGVIIGSPLLGWLAGRWRYGKHRTLIAIVVVYALTWGGLVFFFAPLGIVGVGVLLALMGLVAGGFISIFWAIIRDATPPATLGLVSGLLNPSPFLGVAAFQVLTGAILDGAVKAGDSYLLDGFESAFGLCLAVNLVCLLLTAVIPRKTLPA